MKIYEGKKTANAAPSECWTRIEDFYREKMTRHLVPFGQLIVTVESLMMQNASIYFERLAIVLKDVYNIFACLPGTSVCEKDLFFGVESQLWCAVSDRFRAQAVMHCWSETLDPGKCSSGLEGFYQLERTV